ncbi:MAG: gliding motility lipoprotein GldB [Flavobacteriaceae bacterium]
MIYRFFLSVIFLGLIACSEEYKTPEEITEIDINVDVKRFDKDFYNADINSFDTLKEKYPYFIPRKGVDVDSLWTAKKIDTLEQELLEESVRIFPEFQEQTADLKLLFQHIKYNFPEFEVPEVVTSTSMVSYRDKVLLQNNILLIAIDTYLGADHKFYAGIPTYISANLKEEQLVSDVADVYARQYIQAGNQRSLLNQMVYFGKILYLKDLFMPFKSEASRIGYSQIELEWSKANESEIWSYFVEKDLLFSTDPALSGRFIAPAPFSKFYLELDNESPGMLGRYIGWQIVKSFMKKNDVSLRELTTLGGKELFEKSKYKPEQ